MSEPISRIDLDMITLRGDPADPAFGPALAASAGVAPPRAPGIAFGPEAAVAWMSPDEWMLFLPRGSAPRHLAALGSALAGVHHLAVDVSDARAVFRLQGPGLRDALAKGLPIDLDPAAFGPGSFRRTRLGQVAAAVWVRPDGAFELMCFRSVAGFVADWLANATDPLARVGYYPDS